jgi:hypothetical protein
MSLSRRAILCALVLTACGKSGERCATCGMRVDPNSAFRAVLGNQVFDSPRCALTAYRKQGGTLRVQEFYSRDYQDGAAVRFVKGSDVLGPMGPDLVPVDPSRVDKFEHDHGGTRTMALSEVDEGALEP